MRHRTFQYAVELPLRTVLTVAVLAVVFRAGLAAAGGCERTPATSGVALSAIRSCQDAEQQLGYKSFNASDFKYSYDDYATKLRQVLTQCPAIAKVALEGQSVEAWAKRCNGLAQRAVDLTNKAARAKEQEKLWENLGACQVPVEEARNECVWEDDMAGYVKVDNDRDMENAIRNCGKALNRLPAKCPRERYPKQYAAMEAGKAGIEANLEKLMEKKAGKELAAQSQFAARKALWEANRAKLSGDRLKVFNESIKAAPQGGTFYVASYPVEFDDAGKWLTAKTWSWNSTRTTRTLVGRSGAAVASEQVGCRYGYTFKGNAIVKRFNDC
ncbi:MAG: hypothetical protein K1X89_12920 [Myxococcaceae bacterium]|nr:hypothetical protein [Myxococcaceae bacterium]